MSLTQDDLDALHGGMLAGGTIARRDAQIAAFRAIRIAVTYVRSIDKRAKYCRDTGVVIAADVQTAYASQLRRVIREAIGSKKATKA